MSIVTCVAVLFLLVPITHADQVIAGAMTSEGNGDDACAVSPLDATESVPGGTVEYKVTCQITEVGRQQDKLDFSLDMIHWMSWPDNALGDGRSSGDDATGASDTRFDTYEVNDSTGVLELKSKRWSESDSSTVDPLLAPPPSFAIHVRD